MSRACRRRIVLLIGLVIAFMLISVLGRSVLSMASAAKNARQSSTSPKNQRLIWIDCEMTGLDLSKHTLVEIAVIVTEGDLHVVAEGPQLVIHQDETVLKDMTQWCNDTFSKNGLLDRIRASDVSMLDAESKVVDFLREHTESGVCPLAGNSVNVDRTFIDKFMPTLSQYLHYRTVDVSTVKELCRRWYPEQFCKSPRKAAGHRALDDIQESIRELDYYRKTVFIASAITP